MTTAKRKIHASPLCERYGGVTEAGGGEGRQGRGRGGDDARWMDWDGTSEEMVSVALS